MQRKTVAIELVFRQSICIHKPNLSETSSPERHVVQSISTVWQVAWTSSVVTAVWPGDKQGDRRRQWRCWSIQYRWDLLRRNASNRYHQDLSTRHGRSEGEFGTQSDNTTNMEQQYESVRRQMVRADEEVSRRRRLPAHLQRATDSRLGEGKRSTVRRCFKFRSKLKSGS